MTVSDLKPEWRVQLERLGVEGVQLVLLQQGRDATVQLWPQVADSPRRSDVEDWLETQLDKQDRRNTSGFARLPQPDSFHSDISKPSDFFSKLLVGAAEKSLQMAGGPPRPVVVRDDGHDECSRQQPDCYPGEAENGCDAMAAPPVQSVGPRKSIGRRKVDFWIKLAWRPGPNTFFSKLLEVELEGGSWR